MNDSDFNSDHYQISNDNRNHTDSFKLQNYNSNGHLSYEKYLKGIITIKEEVQHENNSNSFSHEPSSASLDYFSQTESFQINKVQNSEIIEFQDLLDKITFKPQKQSQKPLKHSLESTQQHNNSFNNHIYNSTYYHPILQNLNDKIHNTPNIQQQYNQLNSERIGQIPQHADSVNNRQQIQSEYSKPISLEQNLKQYLELNIFGGDNIDLYNYNLPQSTSPSFKERDTQYTDQNTSVQRRGTIKITTQYDPNQIPPNDLLSQIGIENVDTLIITQNQQEPLNKSAKYQPQNNSLINYNDALNITQMFEEPQYSNSLKLKQDNQLMQNQKPVKIEQIAQQDQLRKEQFIQNSTGFEISKKLQTEDQEMKFCDLDQQTIEMHDFVMDKSLLNQNIPNLQIIGEELLIEFDFRDQQQQQQQTYHQTIQGQTPDNVSNVVQFQQNQEHQTPVFVDNSTDTSISQFKQNPLNNIQIQQDIRQPLNHHQDFCNTQIEYNTVNTNNNIIKLQKPEFGSTYSKPIKISSIFLEKLHPQLFPNSNHQTIQS